MEAIEIQPNSAQNSNINLLKGSSFDSQSDKHVHPVPSEQHGLMNQNNIVSEENNDEEFDTQKANAKHRKTTIADAINAVDQSNKKKTSSRLVVKKKKKKGKKGKGTGNDLLYI